MKCVLMLMLLIIFFCQGSFVSAADDSWQHDLQPYIWFPTSVKGTSTVEGGTIDLDLDANDVTDLLNFALSIRYEAWKERFGLIVDGMYVDLEGDFDQPAPPVNIKPDIDQAIVDLAGAYRFDQDKWLYDLIGGLRYTYIKQKIALQPPGITLGGSEDYVELMFGARAIWALAERWKIALRGDMSGFGIGNSSDLTWNLLLGADYKPWKKASLKFGYRIYDIKYSTGSGADEFGFDSRLQGPYLGASFYF